MKSTAKLAVIFGMAIGMFFVLPVPNADAATLRTAAVMSANSQKGAKYVWGRAGGYSRGYDCSGLVYWAYRQHGRTLQRTAQGQYNHSQHISTAASRFGDLIFIRDSHGSVKHVGFYTGVGGGKRLMTNANSGPYRGYRVVVSAPLTEYLGKGLSAVYGRY